MKTRAVSVCVITLLMVSSLAVRIFYIGNNFMLESHSAASLYTFDLSELRGDILDCNGEKLVNLEKRYYAVAMPSVKGLEELITLGIKDNYSALKEKASKGMPVSCEVKYNEKAGDSVFVSTIYDRYALEQSACHIIGYTDSSKNGVYGIEKSYNSFLKEYTKSYSVSVNVNAKGAAMLGSDFVITQKNYDEDVGVILTIDKRIQKIAEQEMKNSGIAAGAVVVMDIKTGALRAVASTPVFSPVNLESALTDKNSPFVNRALEAYSAGSVFKVAVAASAIENGIVINDYSCTGKMKIGDVTFACNKETAHGIIDLQQALCYSCNTYFINLALKIGAENLYNTVKNFGFGEEIKLADYIYSKSGNVPSLNTIKIKGELANLSFGQGELLVTPVQICKMFCVIANSGNETIPYLVDGLIDGNGVISKKEMNKTRQIISPQTANELTDMLTQVVEIGNARAAKPDKITAAGKTATAQSGWYTGGNEINHTWFGGFFPADNPEYAVVIMRESGASGAVDCAPVFKNIADKIFSLNY